MHCYILDNVRIIKGQQEESLYDKNLLITLYTYCSDHVYYWIDDKKYSYCRDFKVCISKALCLKWSPETIFKYQLVQL